MMDYPELIAEVTERSGESGVALRAKMHLDMAEAAINKVLRVAENEADETLTTNADGEVNLPDDFLAVKTLLASTWELMPADWKDIKINRLSNTLTPVTSLGAYAIKGKRLYTTFADTDLTLYYYAALQPLDLTGTNWLIESDPEIYIYAMLRQIFMAKLDAEKAAAAQSIFDDLIKGKVRSDYRARFGNMPFRIVGGVV